MVSGLRLLLFSVCIIVYQFTLIIEKYKDILVLGEGSTDGLDDTAITVETKYSVKMNRFRKKIFFDSTLQCHQ